MKKIGPSFAHELATAGLQGLAIAWTDVGEVFFGKVTEQQRAAALAVLDTHDADSPVPRPVPDLVTKYQCCVILARHNLLSETDAFFGAMAADDPRRLAWEMATTVQRNSESTLYAIAHLGLTDAQADAMFIEAAQVE